MAKPSVEKRCIIVSGLSGAGKSIALNTLEDLGFYCIDNLPGSLLQELLVRLKDPASAFARRVAVGIDARNSEADLAALNETVCQLRRTGELTDIVFLEADTEILTKRFSESRRKHPLTTTGVSLSEALDRERLLLGNLAELADLRLDTSQTTVHELRDLVRRRIADRPAGNLDLQILSFGYKHGVPRDADFVFDVRCLPNPHWRKPLRKYSGKQKPVIRFLEEQQQVQEMLADLGSFLDTWIPRFEAENRSYLCIAVGCTGGYHRSVFIVEQLGRLLGRDGRQVMIKHRDLYQGLEDGGATTDDPGLAEQQKSD